MPVGFLSGLADDHPKVLDFSDIAYIG